ncbi:MAG TPA: hypothetical protein VD966_05505 [Pyrinomonadaceae bacterium]|nr:hypothetical protein [Pyrinomonadaceae bacterium]
MAKYKKKRARELRQDVFRDKTLGLFDRLGDRLEGKGRTILYVIAAVVAVALLAGMFSWWRARKTDEARRALGRAIGIAQAPVTPSPAPGSTTPSFPTEDARAKQAVEEFQKVADKYGDPYREISRYFIATNLLTIDRQRGISELQTLSKSDDQRVSTLAKFALAQAKEADGQDEEAIALYQELAQQNGTIITPETAKLRLAAIYEKQGKKKEAADLLYPIVEEARKAKGPDGKPAPQSAAGREAAQRLEKLDPARYEQLPPEPTADDLGI